MSEKTLIDRLEDGYVNADRMPVTRMRTLLRESIIALEAIERERDELRAQVNHFQVEYQDTAGRSQIIEERGFAIDERDTLRARVEALEAALSRTLNHLDRTGSLWLEVDEQARSVLSAKIKEAEK